MAALEGTKISGRPGCDVSQNLHETNNDNSLTGNKRGTLNWLLRQFNACRTGRHQVPIDWTSTQTGQSASISLLADHVASLTSILSECVACGYYNLICKPVHGSYVTAGMKSVAGEMCAHSNPSMYRSVERGRKGRGNQLASCVREPKRARVCERWDM